MQRAELQACPTAAESQRKGLKEEPEPLQLAPGQRLDFQRELYTLANRPYTGVYMMPQLSMLGPFRIEALLDSVLLQYPGVPLELVNRQQVTVLTPSLPSLQLI